MYLEHFGLTEAPFRITPHTEFFFSGANRGATLDALIYAITHDDGIVKVSGEVGSGKTMLCRVLMERLPEHVSIVYLANPSLPREDILYAISDELKLDLPERARPSTVQRTLQEQLVRLHGEGRRVVILIDEAHAMPVETLEEIRLLSNLETDRHKLLQMVLFGQQELNFVLARPDMRQLKERITHNFTLEPMVRSDVEEYLDFRMRAAGYRGPSVFTPPALKMIADASQGLTRRINILADKCLLAAFSEGVHQISPQIVRKAVADCEFGTIPAAPEGRNLPWGWIGGAAAAVLAVALAFVLRSGPAPEPAVPEPAAEPATALSSPLGPPPAETQPPVAEVPENLMERHLASGRAWLESAPDDRWFLQLMTHETRITSKVEGYLREIRDAGTNMSQIRAYHSLVNGRSRYGVIYGDFPTREAAIQAISQLPPSLQAAKPYPREISKLR